MPIIRLSAHERGGIVMPEPLLVSNTLYAAAHLAMAGIRPQILEAGSTVDMTISKKAEAHPYRLTVETLTRHTAVIRASDPEQGESVLRIPWDCSTYCQSSVADPNNPDGPLVSVYDVVATVNDVGVVWLAQNSGAANAQFN